ncbi:cytosolic carboxypeptidase 2 isoform X2 [Engraulis encrasicolus]|uniref:cytosolic carboxypeptidase 2 isoform X2 n=1 Tax=Engraulis encrasicolus TaxID=184585 RepID=UPI002FD70A5F
MQTSDDAYENFILRHLQHYGLFTGRVSPSCSPRRDQSPGRGRWAITQDYQSDTHPSPPRSPDNITGDEEQDAEGPYPLLLTKPVRTRQLLLDFVRGRPIPRLREPRDLLAIPCLSSPFQGVRWPAECEVTVDDIQHIEWDPPEAEPFYQCTGHERTPMPVGDDRGRVVYAIDPATKMPYFTCSRVGGTRGPLKNPSCPNVPETSLSFESRFESGNLQKAVQVGVHDYELTLRHDLYTTKHTQWFYFRVENMKAGVPYRFTIVNLLKPSSLYSSGMRPLLYSKRAASEQGQGWTRTGTNIKYYRNNVEEDGRPLYSLTWTLEFPYGGDTCYLAHCYPYTFSQLQRYLYAVMARSSVAAYCKLRVLCRSIAGNPVYVLTITAPGDGSEESAVKPAVVLTARVHPGETNSSWIMQGFLDFILSDSPDACLLREMFVFKVIPMLNPDGVVVGNYRCSLAGRDLNRNYQTLLQESFPCVWYTRNMVKRLLSERDVILYCDLHGHSRKNNVFMYGCDSRHDTSVDLQERVFPLMMSKNAQDKFSFSSCKFQVQKSKEGTGRIVMWRLGIRNSYTMESTFGGSTLGNRTGTHFTTRDLKAIGFHLCDTLLDYCDPDESKAQQCLAELNTLVALKMRRKLGLGDIDFEGSLDIVSVSDFESSTGGSNSSESDGPPVHLMSSVKQSQIQPPKKQLRSRKERNRLHRKLTRRTISRSAPKSTDTMVTTQPQPQESQPCTMSKKKSQDILTMVKTQTRARAEIHQCAICFQTSAPNHDLGFGCSAQIRRGARMPHHSPQEMFLHTVEAYDISTALPKFYRGGHVACPGAQPRPISGSSVPVSVHKDKQGQALPIHTASLTLSPRYEACQVTHCRLRSE